MAAAKKETIKVMVNPTLAGWSKSASYKKKSYAPGEVHELPEDCLRYRTKHFGSVVASFVRKEVVDDMLAAEDDGTIVE